MTGKVEAYIKRGHRKVSGWLTPVAAEVLADLAGVQRRLGIAGGVAEIGVHHGKLFILLHLLTDSPEISVAWDLFERQNENIDDSGRGDQEIFRANLLRHGCDVARIRIRTENSLNLTVSEVLEKCGGSVRMFSIDGGHTAEITVNDLSLAEKALCRGGVIVLDDFFNEMWPGVAEGTCRHFSGGTDLIPFAIGGNKLFLTNDAAMAKCYMEGVAKPRKGYGRKQSALFGHEVVIFVPVERNLAKRLYWTAAHTWARQARSI